MKIYRGTPHPDNLIIETMVVKEVKIVSSTNLSEIFFVSDKSVDFLNHKFIFFKELSENQKIKLHKFYKKNVGYIEK